MDIPSWVLRFLRKLIGEGFHGECVIHFARGQPVKWETRRVGKPEEV